MRRRSKFQRRRIRNVSRSANGNHALDEFARPRRSGNQRRPGKAKGSRNFSSQRKCPPVKAGTIFAQKKTPGRNALGRSTRNNPSTRPPHCQQRESRERQSSRSARFARSPDEGVRGHVFYERSIVTDCTTMSLVGLSCRFRGRLVILSTTSCPSTTSPKMVCLPVSHVVGATVMKNCDPFVFGPALAIASFPGLSNLCGEPLVSSSNW